MKTGRITHTHTHRTQIWSFTGTFIVHSVYESVNRLKNFCDRKILGFSMAKWNEMFCMFRMCRRQECCQHVLYFAEICGEIGCRGEGRHSAVKSRNENNNLMIMKLIRERHATYHTFNLKWIVYSSTITHDAQNKHFVVEPMTPRRFIVRSNTRMPHIYYHSSLQ